LYFAHTFITGLLSSLFIIFFIKDISQNKASFMKTLLLVLYLPLKAKVKVKEKSNENSESKTQITIKYEK
jgi:hypothetical protein